MDGEYDPEDAWGEVEDQDDDEYKTAVMIDEDL